MFSLTIVRDLDPIFTLYLLKDTLHQSTTSKLQNIDGNEK